MLPIKVLYSISMNVCMTLPCYSNGYDYLCDPFQQFRIRDPCDQKSPPDGPTESSDTKISRVRTLPTCYP